MGQSGAGRRGGDGRREMGLGGTTEGIGGATGSCYAAGRRAIGLDCEVLGGMVLGGAAAISIRFFMDSKPEDHFSNPGRIKEGDATRNTKKGKSKNAERKKKKRKLVLNPISSDNLLETTGENAEDEVYQMSSGDEDYSKGMKKWISHYHKSRPGLKVLQERIDDFIMAHEAKEEQAKAERLAQAAEGGWTVVVHQKGRKKTTEAESGIAVGSVAQAAVLDKMGKKKKKEVGLDFYQFNRREAHRNEIMMLQSKFEQDKKRIQQMRAARKFRPY